ncbi:hypothetical protein B0H67DRAFT_591261 [Lasiosphaeris hirsuta]|uniref:Ecp2 effector protein-like domain-containing protein n=1 Tax=Lasiosphaeris hirsuta TaxID=260670 RepID=A0AA39ZVM1_9PEZI|nr:hypothetical protein B0H67DRAFT_591261 [Lasiosphaeris hirsuta]
MPFVTKYKASRLALAAFQNITTTNFCHSFGYLATKLKMKLSTSLPNMALLATTTAASPFLPNHLLPRAAMCWTNSIESTTTSTSPLVSDCLALATSDTIPAFTPTPENNYSFDLRHGTCGFKGVFNPAGGSLPAEENVIAPEYVESAIQYAVEQWGGEGRVQAKGAFACMIPGMQVKVGWTLWEMYAFGVPEAEESEAPVVEELEVEVKRKRH